MAVLLHGYVTVPTGGWDLTVQLAGSPVRSVTVPADDYLFSDLVDEVKAQIQASGVELESFVCQITANMVVLRGTDPNNTTITWIDTDLRDHLGYTGATTLCTATDIITATLPPSAYLPLAYEAAEDVPQVEELRSVAYSDTRQYTTSYGRREWRRVRLRFQGAPRASSVDEYLRVQRWWEYVAAPGAVFRYYPRSTVTTAYAVISNPYGYTVHTHAEPQNFDPDLVTPGWYSQWAIACRWSPGVEP